MKKSYIAPAVMITAINTSQLIMASPTGTNVPGLGVNGDAGEGMEGHSRRRRNEWDDEWDEEEEEW